MCAVNSKTFSSLEAKVVGDVASMTANVHAALAGISAGSRALSSWLGGSSAWGRGVARSRSGGDGSSRGSRRGLLGGCSARRSATRKDLRTRTLGRVILVVWPDAEVYFGVSFLVDTRDLDSVCRNSIASAGDGDLRASVVELSLAAVGAVETDVLRTDEVVTVGNALGNLEGDAVLGPCAPSLLLDVTGWVTDSFLVNLEPVTGTVVGSSGGGCLGHVDLTRARVLHLCADTKGHGKRISSLDLSSSLSGLIGSSDVATEVDAVRSGVVEGVDPLLLIRLWAPRTIALTHLGGHICRLACVGTYEVGGSLTINDKLVEEVVGRCQRHHACKEGKRGGWVHHLEMWGLGLWKTKVFLSTVVERKTEVNVKEWQAEL
jgi:hypothetical protein